MYSSKYIIEEMKGRLQSGKDIYNISICYRSFIQDVLTIPTK